MNKVYIYKVCDGVWSWVGDDSLKSAQESVKYLKSRVTNTDEAAEHSEQRSWEYAPTLGELVQQPKLKKCLGEGIGVQML
jgi:hypothetical protein